MGARTEVGPGPFSRLQDVITLQETFSGTRQEGGGPWGNLRSQDPWIGSQGPTFWKLYFLYFGTLGVGDGEAVTA